MGKKAMKAKAMKSAMKKAKTGMKKVMKVSKIGKGKLAKSAVFKGRKEKTVGGLTKSSLLKNKRGKVVSKGASAKAKKAFASSPLKKWMEAVQKARKELKVKGFCPVGGKTAQGKALYAKVKSIIAAK